MERSDISYKCEFIPSEARKLYGGGRGVGKFDYGI